MYSLYCIYTSLLLHCLVVLHFCSRVAFQAWFRGWILSWKLPWHLQDSYVPNGLTPGICLTSRAWYWYCVLKDVPECSKMYEIYKNLHRIIWIIFKCYIDFTQLSLSICSQVFQTLLNREGSLLLPKGQAPREAPQAPWEPVARQRRLSVVQKCSKAISCH